MTDENKKLARSEYNKAWYLANKDKRKEYNRNRRKANPEKTKEEDKRGYERRLKENQEYRENNRDSFAIQQIVRKFNVDHYTAENLFLRSKETCDSCGVSWLESGQKFRFHVDHDHNDGRVRGILCHGCNTALGLLKESKDNIYALLDYLERN